MKVTIMKGHEEIFSSEVPFAKITDTGIGVMIGTIGNSIYGSFDTTSSSSNFNVLIEYILHHAAIINNYTISRSFDRSMNSKVKTFNCSLLPPYCFVIRQS